MDNFLSTTPIRLPPLLSHWCMNSYIFRCSQRLPCSGLWLESGHWSVGHSKVSIIFRLNSSATVSWAVKLSCFQTNTFYPFKPTRADPFFFLQPATAHFSGAHTRSTTLMLLTPFVCLFYFCLICWKSFHVIFWFSQGISIFDTSFGAGVGVLAGRLGGWLTSSTSLLLWLASRSLHWTAVGQCSWTFVSFCFA